MNKENCALKLVDEIIPYYDTQSKKHQITKEVFTLYAYLPFKKLLVEQPNDGPVGGPKHEAVLL